MDSQTHSISGSLSQSQSSQWPWRDEFKSHTSKISLYLSDSIKKSCEKALDDELQSYQVWKKIPSVKLRGLDDNCMYIHHIVNVLVHTFAQKLDFHVC